MPTDRRSLRFGYKYLWDDSQKEKDVWNRFYIQDYKFLTPQGRSGIKTGKTQYRGEGGPVGPTADPGGVPNTFNLQPRMMDVGAQREASEPDAKEYRRKRLFSWALFHNPDETASLFSTTAGQGIPTHESTTTDGGGRGGPREVSKEEGMKKFFWGMVRYPYHRNTIEQVSGDPEAGLETFTMEEAGSEFLADRIAPNLASQNTLFGKYQRDILPKAIWKIKRLSEEMLVLLLARAAGIAGFIGARTTLDTYSEEELAILIMEGIQFNLEAGLPEEEAVREAMVNSAERRYESKPDDSGRKQMVDIDPQFQPLAARFLTNYFREQSSYMVGQGDFDSLLDEYSGGGAEVTQLKRRLEAAYRLQKQNYKSTHELAQAIARRMEGDIRHHIVFDDEGPQGRGMGYGAARRYRAAGTTDYKYIYTAPISGDGIGIYFVNIYGGQPTVIPFVFTGPNTNGSLHRKMIKDLFSNYQTDLIEKAITEVQVGGLRHNTEGDIWVSNAVTQTAKVDFQGDGFQSKRGFGKKLPNLLYVKTQTQTVAPDVVAKEVYDWVRAGADAFLNNVTIGQESNDLLNFLRIAQGNAEKVIGEAEHQAEGNWPSWLETLGGNHEPLPVDSYNWARFLHPRPFISEDRRGV